MDTSLMGVYIHRGKEIEERNVVDVISSMM